MEIKTTAEWLLETDNFDLDTKLVRVDDIINFIQKNDRTKELRMLYDELSNIKELKQRLKYFKNRIERFKKAERLM
jgi:hypothetical protein